MPATQDLRQKSGKIAESLRLKAESYEKEAY
jgi:hypothetical protein